MPAKSKPPPQFVDFSLQDRAPVLTVMRSLRHDRDGWINIAPALEADQVTPPSAITRIFGPKGPEIPFGTWVPGERKKGGVEPASLGLQHGAGARAIWHLRDRGFLVPEGWKVLSDHGRRGIVLSVPDEVEPEPTLDWLLQAAIRLTTLHLPPDWRAAVHRH